RVLFGETSFHAGNVSFARAAFDGTLVDFSDSPANLGPARFIGCLPDFSEPASWARPPLGIPEEAWPTAC
ncbi:hypothetical protein, partial [Actinoplanes sp. NPDC020271]|uniref:hypothetical protein n=1 Tax=Actinoplanes sp. NPDC020271 TaxID=3363896 RepID=UPI0037B63382